MRRLCSGEAACDNRRLSPMIKMNEVKDEPFRLIFMAMKTKEVQIMIISTANCVNIEEGSNQ